jgi:hypothetical protein
VGPCAMKGTIYNRYHGPSHYDQYIIYFIGCGPMHYKGNHIYRYHGPSC